MILIKKKLFKITGNTFSQKLLEKNVKLAQDLMGIGTGSGVFSSGEKVILNILLKHYHPPFYVFEVGSNKGQFLELIIKTLQPKTNEFAVSLFKIAGTVTVTFVSTAGVYNVTILLCPVPSRVEALTNGVAKATSTNNATKIVNDFFMVSPPWFGSVQIALDIHVGEQLKYPFEYHDEY